ncbi:MAG: hypothetical protein AB7L09_03135 [Nitrospira sp.]
MTTNTLEMIRALQRFSRDDDQSAATIRNLMDQLSDAMEARASGIQDALLTLERYASHQAEVHGFDPSPDVRAVATTERAKKKAKRTTKKKVTKKRSVAVNPTPAPVACWPGILDETILLSAREERALELLKGCWPRFTEHHVFASAGIVGDIEHVSALIHHLRKKGVPIESAVQARRNDKSIAKSETGYRLV